MNLVELYRGAARWAWFVGVLAFFAVAIVVYLFGILNGLTFTYGGYLLAKGLFEDKLLVIIAYVTFSMLTFAILWLIDHA